MRQSFCLLLLLTALLLSCSKERGDLDSPDLEKYLIRDDSTFMYGFATAIKVVPDRGSIRWTANNYIGSYKGNYGLALINYGDTTNWQLLEKRAFVRESLTCEFDPFKIGKQKIVDKISSERDPNLNRGRYHKSADGGDVSDAAWDIDMSKDSYVKVEKIDRVRKVIEGSFDLHFKVVSQSTLPGIKYAERARFKSGKFKAKIFE